ncbi:MAG: type II toxin-antitoxin system VapC family toxin [Elainellaceae cyanobacterium]
MLDTNVCIQLLNKPSPQLVQKLSERPPSNFLLCSIVKSELYYGAYKSSKQQQNLKKLTQFFQQFKSLPFDDLSASIAGQIRTQLDAQGCPIGPNDLLIAAIALANELTLITHNTREFARIDTLAYEDWE